MRYLVMLLALGMGGFMLFDGVHGFLTGRYLTPESGAYGPWTHLVQRAGLTPDSHLMRAIFVAYGLAWLTALLAYARRRPGARGALMLLALATSWYLMIGTVLCVAMLVLLCSCREPARPKSSPKSKAR